jgi:hypothetical protein
LNTPIHRDTDSRICGAATTVIGQSNVYINGLLVSVQGDTNTHGAGELSANNNDGSVYINGKKIVLKGSTASPDNLFPPLGPPHDNPISVGASPNVFACGGAGGGGSSDGGGNVSASSKGGPGSAQQISPDENIRDINTNTQGFCKGVSVYRQLIDDGYTPAAASGIVGNILHENDQFQADIEYGTGIGRGWLQWSYSRRDSFEQYAAVNGLEPDTDTANYNYLQYELDGRAGNHWTRGYSLEEYKSISDPTAAAEYFMRGYERPAEATANLAARKEYARRLYDNDHNCDGGSQV